MAMSIAAAAGVAVAATPATASTANPYELCTDFNFQGTCAQGYGAPGKIPDLRYSDDPYLNDSISSISTGDRAIEAWTDPNFQGIYGYFQPNYRWYTLSYPYQDSISSISSPGF
ncbi:hypothetical protein ACWDA7_36575 [Streptomyces sp. NPDC001156]